MYFTEMSSIFTGTFSRSGAGSVHFMPAATTRPSKRNFTESYSEIVQGLQNKTLVVTTIIVSYDHN